MSAALGPGVRVYIRWAPNHCLYGETARGLRCATGTVLRGPDPPGMYELSDDRVNISPVWWVRPDNGNPDAVIDEDLLVPIDDDDKAETIENEREINA